MRGVLFSLEKAARAQQVRAEIGRLLRQHYDASLPPISEHLAEVIKKLEQSEPGPYWLSNDRTPNEQTR